MVFNLLAPHAAPERQASLSVGPPSPNVAPPPDPTHFSTATPGIYPLAEDSSLPVSNAVPVLSPGITSDLNRPPACALRPVIPINACTLRITAAAGTELKPKLLRVTSLLWLLTKQSSSPLKVFFTTRRPSSYTRHGCIVCFHCAIFPLLPPVGVWTAFSQFQCGWSSSHQSRTRRLVSRYLTNKLIPIWAHLDGKRPRLPLLVLRRYAVLANVSSSYPPSGSFRHYHLRPPLSAKQQSCFRYCSTCMC